MQTVYINRVILGTGRAEMPLCFIPQVSAMRLNLILALSLFACLTFSLAKDQRRLLARGRRRGVGPKRARKQTSIIALQQGRSPESNGQDGSIFIESYKNTKEPKPNYVTAGQCWKSYFETVVCQALNYL